MVQIEAQFASREGSLNGVVIERTPLAVTAALYKLIPFLIITNRLLNSIVWTSSSNTRNLTIIILISIIILHWGEYILLLMPTIIGVMVCGVVWILNKSILPLKLRNTTSTGGDLTMTQMFNSMVNFNCMFEFLFPIDRKYQFNLKPVLIGSIMVTPFYIYLINEVINVRVYILVVFLAMTLWYSSMFVVSRAILWRWKVFRWLVNSSAETTVDFSRIYMNDLEDDVLSESHITLMVNEFGMKLAKIDSKSSLLELCIVESERYILGIGWSKRLLMTRSGFSTINGKVHWLAKGSIEDSVRMSFGPNFQWVDQKWEITQRWSYGDLLWRVGHSMGKATRWRIISRRGIVSI